MADESPKQRLAELIKRLEASGHRVVNMAADVKAMGFVGGIGEHQKKNRPSLEPDTESGAASGGK